MMGHFAIGSLFGGVITLGTSWLVSPTPDDYPPPLDRRTVNATIVEHQRRGWRIEALEREVELERTLRLAAEGRAALAEDAARREGTRVEPRRVDVPAADLIPVQALPTN